MCSSLHPLQRQSPFSLLKKNTGTLDRITTAVHTRVFPLDPMAFTEPQHACLPPLHWNIQMHYFYKETGRSCLTAT